MGWTSNDSGSNLESGTTRGGRSCFGYSFADEHMNTIIEAALARTDFTLLIFTEKMSDPAWTRLSVKPNTVVVTATRCSLKGAVGSGHKDLWRFERLCKEI